MTTILWILAGVWLGLISSDIYFMVYIKDYSLTVLKYLKNIIKNKIKVYY